MFSVRYLIPILAVTFFSSASGQDFPTRKPLKTDNLPAIFKGRAADRLAAQEVARQDAYRKIIERMYGLPIDGQTDVHDLVLESHEFGTAIAHEIKGMKEAGFEYYDDGMVEAKITVTWREIIEVVTRTVRKTMKGTRTVNVSIIEDVTRKNRDTKFNIVGRGGLKGSTGLEKARALRAAEIDAYARMAAKVFGIHLTAKTTVRDFMLQSDSIKSKLTVSLLDGVRFVDYEVGDETVKAHAALTMREVIETVTRTIRRYGKGGKLSVEDIKDVKKENIDKIIKVVGEGVVKTAKPVVHIKVTPSAKPAAERQSVIEQVFRSERSVFKGIVIE